MATAKAITKDGWFKTGDIASMDEEGFVYIKDRGTTSIQYSSSVDLHSDLSSYLVKDIIIRGKLTPHKLPEL